MGNNKFRFPSVSWYQTFIIFDLRLELIRGTIVFLYEGAITIYWWPSAQTLSTSQLSLTIEPFSSEKMAASLTNQNSEIRSYWGMNSGSSNGHSMVCKYDRCFCYISYNSLQI